MSGSDGGPDGRSPEPAGPPAPAARVADRRTTVAMIAGALVALVVMAATYGGSSRIATDIEARIGFGMRAGAVYALIGAGAGWAVTSLIGAFRARPGR